MTIRLYPSIELTPINKLSSRVAKECIESEIEDALEKSNNLEQTVDNTGKEFDKAKAAVAGDAVYKKDGEDEMKKATAFPTFREMEKKTSFKAEPKIKEEIDVSTAK